MSRLLFMEKAHPAVIETVRRITTGENDIAHAGIRDFDGNEYVVRVNDDATAIIVGIRHQVPKAFFEKNCADELAALLGKHFGKAIAAPPVAEEDHLATVVIPLPEDEAAKVVTSPLLAKAASLRTICLAAPFVKCVEMFQANKLTFKMRVPYRPNESIYLFPAKGNLNVVVSIVVPDKSDRILVRTFLTEFAEAKKLDRQAAGGPGFAFLHGEAPPFPEGLSAAEPNGDESVFWCQFSLSKKSMESQANTELCAEFLANFREYVMYHMQCTRSAMHARMRERVKNSLQVLTRAKTSTTGRPRITIQ
jgi:actin related protein 2/3 complex subunit 2